MCPLNLQLKSKGNYHWGRKLALAAAIVILSLPLIGNIIQPRTPNIVFSMSPGSRSHEVVVIQLYEEIDQGSAGMVSRGVARAQADNAAGVVIDMNTPGGLLSDMLTMIGAINSSIASGIPIYTFVGNYSSAASAGSYVAMATQKIFMGSATVIGPSTPYIVGGTSLEQAHVANYTLSLMTTLAQEHGRNVTAAAQMAQNNTAFTGQQAVQYHLVDGYAGSISQVLQIVNDSGAPIVTVSEDLTEQTLGFLSNSTVDGIFLLLGIVAIALDFLHPTVVLSVAGGVLIVLALIGAEAIQGPSGYPGIILPLALFIAAAVLIVFEIKTGHGFLLFTGVVLGAFATILFAYEVPYSPSPIGEIQYVEIGILVVVGAILALYARYVGSTLRRKPVTGKESLVGKIGIVYSDISPEGEVTVDAITWKARLAKPESGSLRKGDSVIVRRVEGLTLFVDRNP
jgi:membrane-bound serine protease (ClpP class)